MAFYPGLFIFCGILSGCQFSAWHFVWSHLVCGILSCGILSVHRIIGIQYDRRRRAERGVGPSFQPTMGSGERRKLLQRGPGRSPAENGFWCILSLKKTNLMKTNLIFLVILWRIFRFKFTRLALIFFSHSLGARPLSPPPTPLATPMPFKCLIYSMA